MTTITRLPLWLGLAIAVPGCAADPVPTALDTMVPELQAALAAIPATASPTPLSPAAYQEIADELAAVPGVAWTEYVGDPYGTIYIDIGSATLLWNHLDEDAAEPPTDTSTIVDPVNADWGVPPGTPAARTLAASSDWASRFGIASQGPNANDPTYAGDASVTCPAEGKIALVDFLTAEADELATTTPIDGIYLWDRLEMLGAAGGFTVHLFQGDDITAGNVARTLAGYSLIITHGHGSQPSTKLRDARPGSTTGGRAMPVLVTAELLPRDLHAAHLENGQSYAQAIERRLIVLKIPRGATLPGGHLGYVGWTPALLDEVYAPTVDQLWMLNECHAMLPAIPTGRPLWPGGPANTGPEVPVYNFGNALRSRGVAAVFGYLGKTYPLPIIENTLTFLRRMFGGYAVADRPPPDVTPLRYWPACMSVETFFRDPAAPQLAHHVRRTHGADYQGYWDPTRPVYLRAACEQSPEPHAMLRDTMLALGTPAEQPILCWNDFWSSGQAGMGPLCTMGDPALAEVDARAAACQVKVARQVNNTLLTTDP